MKVYCVLYLGPPIYGNLHVGFGVQSRSVLVDFFCGVGAEFAYIAGKACEFVAGTALRCPVASNGLSIQELKKRVAKEPLHHKHGHAMMLLLVLLVFLLLLSLLL